MPRPRWAPPRVRPKDLVPRSGGPAPGPRVDGKSSTEMRYRSESALESIRNPKQARAPMATWKIVRGDHVQVVQGPVDVGKRGRVIEVIRKSHRVVVEGVNYVTKYAVVSTANAKQPMRTEAPIHVSNIAIVCPETNLPSKIGFRFLDDGTKVRIARKSGAVIPRPAILRERRVPRPNPGPKDTTKEAVFQKTFSDAGLVSLLQQLASEEEKLAEMENSKKQARE